MSEQMDKMKKLIEAKKNKGIEGANKERATKKIGENHKAFRNKKTGGLFDK